MAHITFKGEPVTLSGYLPEVGSEAPDFTLVKTDLSELKLSDLKGKKVILNIYPSLDTGVCAKSVRQFNEKANALDNTIVLGISADLPFAASRFCTVEGLENIVPLSTFRNNNEFAKAYGLLQTDGPLRGLLARAVVLVNPEGNIIYTELVPEIAQEPDYNSAINSIV